MQVLAALSVGALIVTGCGGDDDALSEDELVEQGNAICAEHTAPIEAAAGELLAGGQLPSEKDFGKLANETIIPEYGAQIEELRALEPPEDLSDSYAQWLDDSQSLLEQIKKDPSLITDPSNFSSVNQQADELGLASDCHAGPE
ncbi:MAG: hypothetical protein H0U42_01995 [Thermoleophilaceae bacterium]|nr:hypothetical protein [Thermoleophilaceae bacterium]